MDLLTQNGKKSKSHTIKRLITPKIIYTHWRNIGGSFLYICAYLCFACTCGYGPHVAVPEEARKGFLDPLEMELQMVISCRVHAGR